jgi:O-antigen/teichoic acid export membrane protein
MKEAMLLLKQVFFGVLAVTGGVLVAMGLCGLFFESFRFVSKGYPDSFGFVCGAGLFVTGILFLFTGTRYVNRKQTFLSNAWLSIIGMLGFVLFGLFHDLLVVGLADVFACLSDVIVLCLGIYLFRTRRKALAKLTSNPNNALSADS